MRISNNLFNFAKTINKLRVRKKPQINPYLGEVNLENNRIHDYLYIYISKF
jgi:hypothetical protein